MNIQFPPVDDGFIKGMVASGYYSNATEVVRDAVRQLREKQARTNDRFRTAVQKGLEDTAFYEYTPTFFEECEARAHQYAAEGREPNPDVLP